MGLTLELWQAHAGPCTLRLQQPPALTRTNLEAWRMEWCGGTRWSLMEMLELPLHAWHKQHQTAPETATLNRYATGGTGPVPDRSHRPPPTPALLQHRNFPPRPVRRDYCHKIYAVYLRCSSARLPRRAELLATLLRGRPPLSLRIAVPRRGSLPVTMVAPAVPESVIPAVALLGPVQLMWFCAD